MQDATLNHEVIQQEFVKLKPELTQLTGPNYRFKHDSKSYGMALKQEQGEERAFLGGSAVGVCFQGVN